MYPRNYIVICYEGGWEGQSRGIVESEHPVSIFEREPRPNRHQLVAGLNRVFERDQHKYNLVSTLCRGLGTNFRFHLFPVCLL